MIFLDVRPQFQAHFSVKLKQVDKIPRRWLGKCLLRMWFQNKSMLNIERGSLHRESLPCLYPPHYSPSLWCHSNHIFGFSPLSVFWSETSRCCLLVSSLVTTKTSSTPHSHIKFSNSPCASSFPPHCVFEGFFYFQCFEMPVGRKFRSLKHRAG